MMVASAMGATAFQKGLGAMHSLSHPCSANLHPPPRPTNAVVTVRARVESCALEDKMARLAAYLGLRKHSFDAVLELDPGSAPADRHPATLADLGMQAAHVDALLPSRRSTTPRPAAIRCR